jgi:hypothetical protein
MVFKARQPMLQLNTVHEYVGRLVCYHSSSTHWASLESVLGCLLSHQHDLCRIC